MEARLEPCLRLDHEAVAGSATTEQDGDGFIEWSQAAAQALTQLAQMPVAWCGIDFVDDDLRCAKQIMPAEANRIETTFADGTKIHALAQVFQAAGIPSNMTVYACDGMRSTETIQDKKTRKAWKHAGFDV